MQILRYDGRSILMMMTLITSSLIALACGYEAMTGDDSPAPVPGNAMGAASVACPAASHFDGVDLARASIQRNSEGGVTARFAIGVDTVGNLRSDGQGGVLYEQHPLPVQAPPLAPMAPAERESLAVNIERGLGAMDQAAAPLWRGLRDESVQPWAQVPVAAVAAMDRATIQAEEAGGVTVLVPVAGDVVGTLRADRQGNVSYEQHPVSRPGPHPALPVAPADVDTLSASMARLEMPDPATGALWQQFQAALAAARQQASRFDAVDFTRATIRQEQEGLAARLVIGTDQVGNLFVDGQGHVTYEQHVISDPGPHPPAALSAPDRESLAVNLGRLTRTPGAADVVLWGQVLTPSMACR